MKMDERQCEEIATENGFVMENNYDKAPNKTGRRGVIVLLTLTLAVLLIAFMFGKISKVYGEIVPASNFRGSVRVTTVTDADEGVGVNQSNQAVNWILQIRIFHDGEHREFSHKDDFNAQKSFGGYLTKEIWDAAKNGRAAWSASHSSDDPYSDGFLSIALPDDPTIAGNHTAKLEFDGYEVTVQYVLVYEGDYDTGMGWSVENVQWNVSIGEPTMNDLMRDDRLWFRSN